MRRPLRSTVSAIPTQSTDGPRTPAVCGHASDQEVPLLTPTHSGGTAVPDPQPAPHASAPLLAPALQRRLHHASMVKRVGSRVSVGAAAILMVAGAGAGIPAYANTLETEQAAEAAPQVQTLTVAESAPTNEIVRDGYTV